MTKFKRNIDPKKSMNVGMVALTLKIQFLGYGPHQPHSGKIILANLKYYQPTQANLKVYFESDTLRGELTSYKNLVLASYRINDIPKQYKFIEWKEQIFRIPYR